MSYFHWNASKSLLGLWLLTGWWQETVDRWCCETCFCPSVLNTPPQLTVGEEREYNWSNPCGHLWVALKLPQPAEWRELGDEWWQANLCPFQPPARLWLPDLKQNAPCCTTECDKTGHALSGKETLPPSQDTVFIFRLLVISPLVKGSSRLVWQPKHVELAAVGTRCRIGPSSAEA